ncbi:MAG: hypothetical protein JXQ29_12915 [Planctomycetes bacterium]|nr:hypothetical protein [Planctomycetota bacterium]
MALQRFADVPAPDRPPLLARLRRRLADLLPDLHLLEHDFAVPGRGVQDALARGADGGLVLIEFAAGRVEAVPPELRDRMAWFEDNRPILPRLFPAAPGAATRPIRAVLLAPEFGARWLGALDRLPVPGLELRRVRLVRGATAVGFLVEAPRAPGAPREEEPASAAHAATGAAEPRVRVPPFRPFCPPGPAELLAQAQHWLARLSADIQADADGAATVFRFGGEILARMAPGRDHLRIEVPGEPARIARNPPELNRSMSAVIRRYFGLVAPPPSGWTPLHREDLLCDDRPAASAGPERP